MLTDLGQYAFQGEIGRGAMAIVWRAWDTKLERVVAVKESLIPPGTDPQRAQEMAARFVLEAKAAARLSHPNLVSIYDADVWNGRAAIIMEYVEGQTLSAIIDREPLSVASALGVVDQLLDAVAYAHANGVVHRDIKPDNVFVTAIGRVKLSDFGVARVSGMQRLTQAGTVVGTPGYMAPEQILGASVDERADLFSIGVIVYEMLAGANPFGATDGVAPTEIMRRVVNETPPVLEGQVAWVSPELQGALNQSMRKDPASRFHTAQAMLTAFRYCAGGPPTMAEVPLPNYAPAQ
jgi:serine/threonine-protein kinase